MSTIKAKLLYTGNAVLNDSTLTFDGTTLTGVGTEVDSDVLGEFAVVTPAIIDAHSHIGLIRAGEPGSEAEANEHMESMLAGADVLDSLQMDDKGFTDSIEAGVLYSCVLPGSGNIIGGNSAIIRNYGVHQNDAFIRRAGIKGAFGYNPMSTRTWKGQRPVTRMGALAILRKQLDDVKAKMQKEAAKEDADVTYNVDERVLKAILKGEERLRIHVHKTDDIAALLRFVDEYNLDVTVEHTCDVHDDVIYRELAERGIPVVYGPMDTLAYKVELKHESWRNIKYLIESGVQFGLMTDHPVIMQQTLLLCLRWFIRMGFSKQKALEIITRQNAEILKIDDILGTLEAGKWASFICWSDDPFTLGSHPVAIYAEGKLIYSE